MINVQWQLTGDDIYVYLLCRFYDRNRTQVSMIKLFIKKYRILFRNYLPIIIHGDIVIMEGKQFIRNRIWICVIHMLHFIIIQQVNNKSTEESYCVWNYFGIKLIRRFAKKWLSFNTILLLAILSHKSSRR